MTLLNHGDSCLIAGTATEEAQLRLALLDEQCYNSLKTGYRPGSYKNIKSEAHVYWNFCCTHNLSSFPADEWQLIGFSSYVANTVTSIGMVQNYNGGVRKLHGLAGYKVPHPGEANYQLMIQSLRAELAKPVKQAEAMTPEILRDIYDHVNLQDPVELICYTALLVRFYLFLCKSNLVPKSTTTFNPKEQLTRGMCS